MLWDFLSLLNSLGITSKETISVGILEGSLSQGNLVDHFIQGHILFLLRFLFKLFHNLSTSNAFMLIAAWSALLLTTLSQFTRILYALFPIHV